MCRLTFLPALLFEKSRFCFLYLLVSSHPFPLTSADLLPSRNIVHPSSSWGQGRSVSTSLTIRHLPQSLEQLIAASREDLCLCPGLGPQKVRAWGNGLEGLRAGGSPKEMGPQL